MITYDSIDSARADKARAAGKAVEIWEAYINGSRCYVLATNKASEAAHPIARKQLLAMGVTIIAGHNLLTDAEQLVADAADRAAREKDENTIDVYLSSRGWGDYSPVAPSLDLRLTDEVLISLCRAELIAEYDVDTPNLTDAEIINRLAQARHKLQARNNPEPAVEHGIGYCNSCGTYCYGDCEAQK